MKTSRRLTAAEFEAVRPLVRISPERIEAARAVLVDGETMAATAERHGWKSRNTVFAAVESVWQAVDRHRESQAAAAGAGTLLPPGWEHVTLIAPRSLIARFRADVAAEAAKLEVGSPSPAAGRRTRSNGGNEEASSDSSAGRRKGRGTLPPGKQ